MNRNIGMGMVVIVAESVLEEVLPHVVLVVLRTMVRDEAKSGGVRRVEQTGGPEEQILDPYRHLLKD